MKEYRFRINGKQYTTSVKDEDDSTFTVSVNGTEYSVETEPDAAEAQAASPVCNTARTAPKSSSLTADGRKVTSPLPGVIVDIKVQTGDSINAGQEVAVLEAMKMENSIEAPCSGIVADIEVSKGDSVLEGAVIMTIK